MTTPTTDAVARFVALGFLDPEGVDSMKYIATWHDDDGDHAAVGPFDTADEAADFAEDNLRVERAIVARIHEPEEWLNGPSIPMTDSVAAGHSEAALA